MEKNTVIYIQLSAGDRLLWYAIEEEDGATDRIRKLDVPQLDYKLARYSVAVVNSRIYLIGGQKIKSKGYFHIPYGGRRMQQSLEGYLSLDLSEPNSNWVACDGSMEHPAYLQHSAAVSEHDGAIYTVGSEMGRLVCGVWQELPYFGEILCREEGRQTSAFARLLALTQDKLFCCAATNLICLDLRTEEWELIDKDLEGKWSAGIEYNSLLVSFGGTPAAVRVYDIGRRQWLPEPVQGLGPNDGTFLPQGNEYQFGRLWRVGMVDGHPKMALIWSRESPSTQSSEVHCSKFLLRPNNNNALSAHLLSHRVFTVYDAETTPTLVNAAAALDIGKDKKGTDVQSQFKRLTI